LLSGLLPLLAGLATIAALAVGVHYGWQALRGSARLQVKSIRVGGLVRVQEHEIEAYGGPRVGAPILDIDLDVMAQALTRHPWVKSATVRRILPNTVTVDLVEHTPQLLVSLGDVYMANGDAELFKRLASSDGIVLPLLSGLTRELVQKEPERASTVIRDAIALSAACDGSALGSLEQLLWDRDLGWTVIVRSEQHAPPTKIHLGRDGAQRVAMAGRAMRRLKTLGRIPSVVWADGPETAQRLQVRFHTRPIANSQETSTLAKAGE